MEQTWGKLTMMHHKPLQLQMLTKGKNSNLIAMINAPYSMDPRQIPPPSHHHHAQVLLVFSPFCCQQCKSAFRATVRKHQRSICIPAMRGGELVISFIAVKTKRSSNVGCERKMHTLGLRNTDAPNRLWSAT